MIAPSRNHLLHKSAANALCLPAAERRALGPFANVQEAPIMVFDELRVHGWYAFFLG